jgi:hypothetical protein
MEGAQELAAMRGSPNGQHQFFAAIWLSQAKAVPGLFESVGFPAGSE